MSDDSNSDILAFGDFLEYLRQRGFRIGVDHHLRLYDLLNRVSEHFPPQDLETLLAPIFATDKNQQEQFYQAFHAYFSIFGPFPTPASPRVDHGSLLLIKPKNKTQLSERIWVYVLASILIHLTIFASWLLLTLPPANEGKENRRNQTSQPIPIPSETPQVSGSIATTPSPTTNVSSQPLSPFSNLSERYGKAIRGTVTSAPLIIFLLYEIFTYKRRKLILQKQRNKKPPLRWPIQVERASPKLYDSATFQAATRLMRKRQADEFYRMDVEATVAATVESLGYPSFRFTLGSRPPEYLLLIERVSFRDHQASLFEELKKALEVEGIYVIRYFYDSDPRVCCDESGKNYLSLLELHSRTASHRLIIIGTGDHLLNPVSGKLESWTSLLAEWKDRAILTPASPAQWGFRELSLSSQFTMLPATMDGLRALVDCFDSIATAEVSGWKGNEKTGLLPPLSDNPNLKQDLRTYLGDDAFRWLCACAAYPELQWDLTLYLGSLPVMGKNLIREDHLLRMVRLPWFREGSLPDDIRWQLICELDHKTRHGIRSAIVELLERHQPPEESYAADTHRLNLVVQRWLSRRDRQARREMLETLERTPRNQINQDYTLLRFLESDSGSALNLLLPKKFRKLFYRDGIPPLGVRSGIRLIITMVIMASIWFATVPMPVVVTAGVPPKPNTSRDMILIEGGTFMMGSDMGDEPQRGVHAVTVASFYIDKNEVTNAEYAEFIKATGRPAPMLDESDPDAQGGYWKPWNGNDPPPGRERWPVCNVSAKDAEDFAQWLSNRDGVRYRLPTEEEWEFAARNGSKGTLFPWGDSWQEGLANLNGKSSPKDVGSFPQGATEAGVLDMVGNAWEWTSSKARFYDGRPVHADPNGRVRRGGAFAERIMINFQNATDRGWLGDERYKFPTIGFRLARDSY
jgi:formylglycine-generating enzyme required for sulfatase activity